MAFGLYHNFKDDSHIALLETNRILSDSGILCASFRADNIQNRIIDFLYEKRYTGDKSKKFYHKSNFNKKDIYDVLKKSNFKIDRIEINKYVFYKLKMFRSFNQNSFNENLSRNKGYKLNIIGRIINKLLLLISPSQFCSVYVVYARKIK